MCAETQKALERHARYSCRNAPAVSIALERGVAGQRDRAPADLLDISPEGAKLAVPVAVETDEEICLRIKHHDSGLNLPISAQVRWVSEESESVWLVGCSFPRRLSEDTLPTLASLGCLEHENLARLPIDGEASAWRELDPSVLAVQLVDLSSSGISLVSPQPAQIGRRMRLVPAGSAGSEAQIIVHVRCCAEMGDAYLLGCQFQDSRAYEALRGAASVSDSARRRHALLSKVVEQSRLISRTTILLLGGVLIGMALRTSQPFFVMVLGLFSVLAYLALELVAQNRSSEQRSRW